MLSIVPFDHRLNSKDPERPFKAYHRPSVSLPGSSYYSPYQQSYMASQGYERRTAETGMDLRQTPAHMYQQASHHMLDMSAHSMRRDSVKSEQDNMYSAVTAGMPHMHHQGYGTTDLSGGGGMPPTGMSIIHTPMPSAHGTQSTPHGTQTTTHGTQGTHSSMPPRSTSSISPQATATTPPETHHNHDINVHTSDSSSDSSLSGSQKHIPPKKRALNVPVDLKDETYWDKRKKNNESAKRSRESRRMKEDQIAMRVVYLEQDNLQLRTEVSLLKSEIEKLRCMLYNS